MRTAQRVDQSGIGPDIGLALSDDEPLPAAQRKRDRDMDAANRPGGVHDALALGQALGDIGGESCRAVQHQTAIGDPDREDLLERMFFVRQPALDYVCDETLDRARR